MKRLFLQAILIIILAGCGGSTASDSKQCENGICVQIEAVEPVVWGEPVMVTITVTSNKDIQDLGVWLTHDYMVIVEGPQGWEAETRNGKIGERGASWQVDVKANQPIVFTRKISFLKEGRYQLKAEILTPLEGTYVYNILSILLTRKGGVVNPPTENKSGSPQPDPGRFTSSKGVECAPGPCLTMKIAEPVLWGEPNKVTFQIDGKKDFPELGISLYSFNPSIKIQAEAGEFKEQRIWNNGVWWLTDVKANLSQESTFLVTFPPQEGVYRIFAEAYDLAMGMVSVDWAEVHLSREGNNVYYYARGIPAPILTETPWPKLYFTPTPEPSPTPTPEVYPPPEGAPLLSMPTLEAYPPPEEPTLLSSPTPEVSPSPEEPLSSSTPTPTVIVTP